MKVAPHLPLQGQVAVITGAGKGIGRAISLKLAELGAYAVLSGRSREPLEQTAAKIVSGGGNAVAIRCDVSDLRSFEALAAQVEKHFHRLDVLVNNTGIAGPAGPLHQLGSDDWDRILNINLRGVYYAVRCLAPMMIQARSGHIINISSLAGKNPLPNGAAYAASKWALNGLSYSLAEELRAHNVRVSVVCPGSVHTEFSPHVGKNSDRMLQASDVAHVVGMLVTQAPQSFASEVLIRPTEKP